MATGGPSNLPMDLTKLPIGPIGVPEIIIFVVVVGLIYFGYRALAKS